MFLNKLMGKSIAVIAAFVLVTTASAATTFQEDFNGPTLDIAKWTVTKFDGRANAASLSFDAGRLLAAVPGGSAGFNGVSDGTDFTPTVSPLTGDYEIVISGEEILRQTVGGYKDNSGLQLFAGDKTIVIAGNNSGYWFGVGYNQYTKHRIHGGASDGTSACFVDESLALSTLYRFDLSISRVGTAIQIGYRVNGGTWTYTPCGTQTGAVSPKVRVYSGDGGNTVQNGQFTVAMDTFTIAAPAPGELTRWEARPQNGTYSAANVQNTGGIITYAGTLGTTYSDYRNILAAPLSGDSVRIKFRAACNPCTPDNELYFAISNQQAQLNSGATEKTVGSGAQTAGLADRLTVNGDVGYGSGNFADTTQSHEYTIETGGGRARYKVDGVVKIDRAYTGTIGQVDTLLVAFKGKGQFEASSVVVEPLTVTTLTVPANSLPGINFTNPLGSAASCAITAAGSWNNGPTATYGPEGAVNLPVCGVGCKFPNAPSVSLNMMRADATSEYIGAAATTSLAAGEVVAFANNDGLTVYGDNNGSVAVTISCSGAPINGVCGSAANVATATAPTANLCSAGTPSAVATGATNFTWTCSGTNGGNPASCSAPKAVASAVALALARDSTKTESVAHGDGHMGERMDDGVSSGQVLRMSDTLRITCSAASCPWTALVTPAPVAWLKIANGSGTATSSVPSSLVFSVDPFEETNSARVAYIEVDDGTGTKKTWKVTQNPLTDWDEDGVADEWEQRGYPRIDGTRAPLLGKYRKPSSGCDANHTLDPANPLNCIARNAPYGRILNANNLADEVRVKARDLWLWIDQMEGTSKRQIDDSVLRIMAASFQARDVRVLWNNSAQKLPFSAVATFDCSTINPPDFLNNIASPNFDEWRRIVYRHVVWGERYKSGCDGHTRSSGISRSMSGTNLVFVASGRLDESIRQEVGTLMHELGHELGLGHGGPWFEKPEDISARKFWKVGNYDPENRFKPNHISVMNYAFQLDGMIVAPGIQSFDYQDVAYVDVDESNLRPFWIAPLVKRNDGLTETRYGTRVNCNSDSIPLFSDLLPLQSGTCFGGLTPSVWNIDPNDDTLLESLSREVHVSHNEWKHIVFNLTPGFFKSWSGFGVSNAGAAASNFFPREIVNEQPVETITFPTQFGVAVTPDSRRDNVLRVVPGQSLDVFFLIKSTGFRNQEVHFTQGEGSEMATIVDFPQTSSTQILTPRQEIWSSARLHISSSASVGLRGYREVIASVSESPGTFDIFSIQFEVVEAGQSTTPPIALPSGSRIANNFTLTGITNVKPDIYVESGSVVLTGFDVPLPIQVRGGEMSINGGGWTHYISTVNPGDTLRLRTVSSTVAGEKRTVEVAVGGLVRAFEVTTSLDTDGDGVPDAVESAGPNSGDANGDGIPDKDQKNVGTIFSPAGNGYVTFEVSGGCSVAEAISAYTESQLAVQDTSWAYPLGLVSFRLPCSAATVKLYYHGVSSLTGYTLRRYGPTTPGNPTTSAWTTVPNATFGTATVGASTVATASYGLNDGQPGDDTGTDGVIVDPVGPALYVGGPVDANGNPIPVPTNDRSGLIMLAMMLLLAGGLSYRRHRKRIA